MEHGSGECVIAVDFEMLRFRFPAESRQPSLHRALRLALNTHQVAMPGWLWLHQKAVAVERRGNPLPERPVGAVPLKAQESLLAGRPASGRRGGSPRRQEGPP